MLNPAEAGFRAWTETRGWGAEEGSRHSPLYIIGTVCRACKPRSVVAGSSVAVSCWRSPPGLSVRNLGLRTSAGRFLPVDSLKPVPLQPIFPASIKRCDLRPVQARHVRFHFVADPGLEIGEVAVAFGKLFEEIPIE
jgi:hypothetical protein